MANKVQTALDNNKDLILVWSQPQNGVYCIYNRSTGKRSIITVK